MFDGLVIFEIKVEKRCLPFWANSAHYQVVHHVSPAYYRVLWSMLRRKIQFVLLNHSPPLGKFVAGTQSGLPLSIYYRSLKIKKNNFCNWKYVMRYVILYHLYCLKNVKNTDGGVSLLVKLQAKTCNFTKNNTSPWVFFTFFKLYNWYKIT